MANIFELNINLNTTGTSETEQALKETTEGSINPTPVDSGGKKNGGKGSLKGFVATMAVDLAKDTVLQVANYQTNKIATVYDNQARANKINNITSTANTLMDAGIGIASAAMAGAAFGPIGAVVGAVVGVVAEAVSIGVEVNQRLDEWEMRQEDNIRNAAYAQERLGILILSKGR